jgi:hypothetical protein
MAKQKGASGAAEAVAEPSTAVAVVGSQGGAVPDYLRDYAGPRGTEHITSDDLTIPRIKVGQSMSDEVKNKDLEEGALFVNVTGEVIAEPGVQLPFVPIVFAKEYILWRPRKDNGGGILARAKPVHDGGRVRYKWDNPNQSFDVKVEGKVPVTWTTKEYIDEDGLGDWGSEIPGDKTSGIAATAHYNYVVALPTLDNTIAALSLSRTAAKKAKDLNAMLKMGSTPMFARVFTVQTVDDHKDDDKFKNYKFRPAGHVQDEGDFLFYRDVAKSMNERGFTVDQSDGGDASDSSTGGDKPL